MEVRSRRDWLPVAPSLDIGGHGQNLCLNCDWDESDGDRVMVRSSWNEFTRCTTAPLPLLEVTGARNILRNCKLLERYVINGSFNELWNPLHLCPRVDITGRQNLFNRHHAECTPIFGSGIKRLVYAEIACRDFDGSAD